MPPEAEDDDPIGIERLRLGKQSPEGDRRDGEPTQDEQAAPLDRTDRADGQRCVYCPGEGRGKLAARAKRSAGTLASAGSTTSSSAGGTEGAPTRSDGAGPAGAAQERSAAVGPVNGGSPASISYSTQPRA